jgi:cell division septum initiation protein DivIVA
VTLPKKFVLPDFAREALTPQEREVLAWVEQLAAVANGLQQEVEQLEQEASQLRKQEARVVWWPS